MSKFCSVLLLMASTSVFWSGSALADGPSCNAIFVSKTSLVAVPANGQLTIAKLVAAKYDDLSAKSTNVLVASSELPFGAFPFDRLSPKVFSDAFELKFNQANASLQVLRTDSSPPTFANTILPLERLDKTFAKMTTLFKHMLTVQKTPELEALDQTNSPKLAKFREAIFFDKALFKRVEDLYARRAQLGLGDEQIKKIEKYHYIFRANAGAGFSDATQERIMAIDSRLTTLTSLYNHNLAGAIHSQELYFTTSAEVAGLPQKILDRAKKKAADERRDGYVFTDEDFSWLMKYVTNRKSRELVWQAENKLATTAPFDNRPVVFEIAKLREEKAKISGFKTHAHMVLRGRMAGSPEVAREFLNTLAKTYVPAAKKELQELRDFAGHDLAPWDVEFYSAKLSEQKFAFDQSEITPYFSLEQVLKGAFYVAQKLYGVTFQPRPDLPAWDPGVQVFEVRDRDGKYLALFYFDPYQRDSKKSGAWNFALQPEGLVNGQRQQSQVVNVENFMKPGPGQTLLLGPRQVRTVFHELGHALHAILSKVDDPNRSGTNVVCDFVELPSQLNENWAFQPEVLKVYARHFQTGKELPDDILKRFLASENFHAGLNGLDQIRFALLDLAWHASDLSDLEDYSGVPDWERQVTAPYEVLEGYGQLNSSAFAHIFSGPYAAGYYSYKWSEILAADAFSVFKSAGIFDQATADRFRTTILEKGATAPAVKLYLDFRGGPPDINQLLRAEGLLPQ